MGRAPSSQHLPAPSARNTRCPILAADTLKVTMGVTTPAPNLGPEDDEPGVVRDTDTYLAWAG